MNQKRILVVDDETAFLLSMKRALQAPEFFIATAESFGEAIALLDEQEFHIVITDIRLTTVMRKEGLEILQYVKGISSRTIVIILTGYGTAEIMESALSMGAHLYLEKPVSLNVLINIINNQLGNECNCLD
jgi:DNA-binding NtrC family response regulator